MKCISCVKEIPINAKICPYCQRDTTASSQVQGGITFLALLGGGAGYLVNGYLGAFIGAIVLGGIGGAILFSKAQKKLGAQPATVQIAQCSREPSSGLNSEDTKPELRHIEPKFVKTAEKSTSARLQELADLKASGLLTEAEYGSTRRKILDDL